MANLASLVPGRLLPQPHPWLLEVHLASTLRYYRGGQFYLAFEVARRHGLSFEIPPTMKAKSTQHLNTHTQLGHFCS